MFTTLQFHLYFNAEKIICHKQKFKKAKQLQFEKVINSKNHYVLLVLREFTRLKVQWCQHAEENKCLYDKTIQV